METYIKLLHLFRSTDETRPWMNEFFNVGKYSMSTDAYTIISVPKFDDFNESEKITKKIKAVFPDEENLNVKIDVKKLSEVFKKIPLEKDFDSKECYECGGDGLVEFEYYASDREIYTADCNCPICRGKGEVKTDKYDITPSSKYIILLNGAYYKWSVIEKIIKAASILNVDEIKIIYQENHKAKFRLNNEVVVMCIDVMYSDGFKHIEYSHE